MTDPAPPTQGADAVRQLVTAPRPEQFSPTFLKVVPFKQVEAGQAQLIRRYGPVRHVRPGDEPDLWTVETERAKFDVLVRWNADGLVEGFRIGAPLGSPWPLRLAQALPWLFPLYLIHGAVSAWTVTSRVDWLTSVAPVVAVGLALLQTSVWAQSSPALRSVYWACVLACLAAGLRLGGLPTGSAGGWDIVVTPLLTVAFGALWWKARRGRRVPADCVALGPVLAGGRFVVAQGGSTDALNYHVAHPTMRYAVDWIGVGAGGRHARGLWPHDPARYAIFGASVLAPLNGEVVAAQDGRPDLPVPEMDSLRPAGNLVRLRSVAPDGRVVHVLLAHLQHGSVRVRVGDHVRIGDVLGAVGNSGNTTEPHLHLGVNVGGTDHDPFSGEGVPFTIDGHFPVRGQITTRPAPAPVR
ncbi:M23 family metallopeptidase [uncultured Deinococcus sp.]|uniref:M23 family metallopeptidase n=1 Tax=uncultured Deinococcus sp. TaxID=158789 RepID=UPI0025EC9FEB|nr:M23 family metallopeptidase [uncultured Deinococcus sp.]